MALKRGANRTPWKGGKDAAYIEPKLLPDSALMPRDNSGGIDFEPRNAMWADGGEITGPKAYLSPEGGQERQDEDGRGGHNRPVRVHTYPQHDGVENRRKPMREPTHHPDKARRERA